MPVQAQMINSMLVSRAVPLLQSVSTLTNSLYVKVHLGGLARAPT
eukprot:CAMPEP_0177256380 /NCGR_PEP_ID=MMETSP0367-20130122/56905_1 /TAXON_ID=447022 ORGANISM="Scrippsiella hangoei-like, Strain SHHI-4" /NCGR_SAMPLE_ID=MMETSP0367 /ASSEMBLY_ACC=CAM_ASM_000362 /LENGTH=44 /DNA_ID= /DNA_START= /DNA_END= /DNA_ORIENTATION=